MLRSNAFICLYIFSATLAIAFAKNNPFGFTDDILAKFAQLKPTKETPVLNKLLDNASRNNWCCVNGLSASLHNCQPYKCCPNYVQLSTECIHMDDLVPVLLRLLQEAVSSGFLQICPGPIHYTTSTGKPSTTSRTTTFVSSTTPNPTNPPTVGPTQGTLVYSCTLDSDHCSGTLSYDAFSVNARFAISRSESVNGVFVTDVTSITTPTGLTSVGPFNGPVCRIPWNFGGKSHYFCSPTYDCITGEIGNDIGHCQKGRFLWGRTVNEKYNTKLNLNSVNLLKSGSFSVEFWAMLWCEGGNECSYADDSIKLTLDDLSGNAPVQFQVNYGNIRQQKSWQRFNFAFTTQKSSALVSIQFERKQGNPSTAHFGFDHLVIRNL